MSTIGERIRKLRLERDLTQEEVGNYIDTSKQTLYKYESGIVTNIPSDKIELLSKLFDVSPAYIMGWEDKYEEHQELPTHFETPKEAMNFLLHQSVVMGFNELDITKLPEDQQVDYANEVLEMMKLVSLKYKDRNK